MHGFGHEGTTKTVVNPGTAAGEDDFGHEGAAKSEVTPGTAAGEDEAPRSRR